MGEIIKDGPWAGFEIISTYTRQQAIDDGILINLSISFPQESRMFKWPVACTSAVWELIESAAQKDEVEVAVYVWDVCWMAYRTITAARKESDCLFFKVLLPLRDKSKPKNLKLMCGPAGPDDPSPALTIMLPEED